jgi:autotransporter-associated beta strand protein
VADSILFANVSSIGGIVWTGTNSTPGLVNLWANAVTNWLLTSSLAAYSEIAPPGDAVTFNDTGSGTVVLSNTVNPANIAISNNSVNYTFQGPGHISGTTGLTKQGSGTATISYAGDNYVGNTIIANGTLQLGSTTALPSGAGVGDLSIGTNGTLDLNGNSQTVNGLSGAGTINNSGAAAATLTFGTASTGNTIWAGNITNTGSGGASFTKVGTNTVTITGNNYVANGTASQVNGGTAILTNNASIISPTAEFWVAQGASSTGTVVVAGGTLVTSNNWLVVGRANASANGTLIVNSGTVQKAGANNIVVGSLGAIGTLIVNGGQVLNDNELWLGENPTAVANLYLNGGLLQATDVRPNSTGAGTPTTTPVAFFNGGTLQATASATNFLQVQCEVMSNGFVLDDNGFTLSIGGAVLQDGDGNGGGLTKLGSGAVYLDVANTYTGTTVVNNGLLAGVGTISGSVLVKSAGSIGAGDAGAVGTLTLNSTPLTIQGKAALRISKTAGTPASDLITGISTANYGGTLVISNATADATPLANGDTFTLFSAASSSGNFTSIVGSPGPGLSYSFNPATGVLTVVTGVVQPPPPTINKITLSGTNVVITGTNNAGSGGTYHLLATNKLAAPLTNWPVLTNGTFDSNGNVAITNAMGHGSMFFILQAP